MEIFYRYIDSPLGFLKLGASKEALLSLEFAEAFEKPTNQQTEILNLAESQLVEYFQGDRKIFEIKICPEGTDFQKKIWKLVEKVPYGKTESYLTIAKWSGAATNARAVGMANGKNPIPIIIPCHRIIGSSGKLTGYSGGVERKKWLLKNEMKYSDHTNRLF